MIFIVLIKYLTGAYWEKNMYGVCLKLHTYMYMYCSMQALHDISIAVLYMVAIIMILKIHYCYNNNFIEHFNKSLQIYCLKLSGLGAMYWYTISSVTAFLLSWCSPTSFCNTETNSFFSSPVNMLPLS